MTEFRKSRAIKGICAVLVGLTAVGASSSVGAQGLADVIYDNAQRVPIIQPTYVRSGAPYTVSVYCEAGETVDFYFGSITPPASPAVSQACTVPAGQSSGTAVATLAAPNIGSTPATLGTVTTRVKNGAGQYTFQNFTNFIVYTDLLNNSYNDAIYRNVIVSPSAETIIAGTSFTVSMTCFSGENVEFRFAGTTVTAKCPPTGGAASAKFIAPAGTYPMTGTVTLPGVTTYQFTVGRATAPTTTVTVKPPSTVEPTLPVSGPPAQTVPLAIAALVLALTGACLVAVGRRRDSTVS